MPPIIPARRADCQPRNDPMTAKSAAFGERIGKLEVGTLATLHVDSVSLMKSDLKPSGAVYTRLAEAELGA